MSEISIDEIIKQAEEIRKKTIARAQSAIEEVKEEAEQQLDGSHKTDSAPIKSEKNRYNSNAEQEDNSGKTAVIHTDRLKSKKPNVDEGIEQTRVIDQKTKSVNISQKTAVVPNTNTKSFFKTKSDEPQYSKNPPEIIERAATIKSKSRFDKTSDLEEIPTIVAVEELERTKISLNMNRPHFKQNDSFVSEEADQIVLEGFEDSTEEISKIDERLAEEQLKQRRQEKVNKFRLFSPDEMNNSRHSAVKNEYKKNDDKTAFLEKLFATKSSFSLKAVLTVIAAVPLCLLNVFQDSAYLPSFLLDYTAYFTAQLVLYLILFAVNFKNIVFGFKLSKGINYSFPISVASVIVLVHSVLLIADTNFYIDNGIPLPFVMAFAFLMTNVGKATLTARIIDNFEFLAAQEDLYTVESIANTVDATIISRGVLTGEPNLKTSIKTDFATNYLDISCSDEPADKISKIVGFISIGLSAVLFIVLSLVMKNWYLGFNTAVCALCISLPVVSIYSSNTSLLGVAKKLKEKGAMINGYEGAATVDNANAIVIEAQDLFGKNSCEIHGIKTFNGAKADDVILKTAAVIMKTKSPLSYVFDDVIIGKQAILPDVDGVVYEDRLGTSAWIYRKKILVGTRELLIHHGVPVPKEEFERKYARKGRKILYLAVTGQVMAMFVVSYNADPDLKRSLRKLEKSGITVLVKSADPFINDESIAELFSLPEGFVRVMNSSNARVFEKYSDMCVEKSPAYIVHNGSALGFVSSMAAAENLGETKKLLGVLVSFGAILGFVLVAMLGFLEGISQITPVNIVIFQAVWCIFVQIVSRIKRLGL
ncbi:MAG: hypothetical protein NC397_02230 [Clostridium sp.]|nr:hypothetical protein [Clostridium sp.]